MFASVPWADALYAIDKPWWKLYGDRVAAEFTGERYSCAAHHGARRGGFKNFANSGAAAVSLALAFGAARVVLLGYDLQRTGGKVHSHGDHPRGLGNAGSMPKWPGLFDQLARHARGRDVINATRETALRCFPRMTLEDALAQAPA